jgi:hypothetical protein
MTRHCPPILVFVLCAASLAGAMGPSPAEIDLDREARLLWETTQLSLFQKGWKFTNELKKRSARSFHPQAGILENDGGPVDVLLRRTEALLEDIRRMGPRYDLSDCEAELAELKQLAGQSNPEWTTRKVSLPAKIKNVKNGFAPQEVRWIANEEQRFPIFKKVFLLQRRIAFANPLLDFDRIVFVKREPATLSHMVDQYFGIVQVPADQGGLFVLEDAFSNAPKARNLLADAVCENGRLKGRKLLPGSFLSPELSFDGKQIYFAFTETKKYFAQDVAEATPPGQKESFTWRKGYEWDETRSFHIFRVNVDASRLTMLTDGPWNDFDPCVLPNGRIAFVSERRGGEGRCHPRPCPSYVLHSMLPDGSDITPLSYHETNEWHPSLNNEGEIVYARWDYVDRVVGGGQYPWVTKADGRDARALYGNYDEGRIGGAQFEPKALPDTAKYVAVICGHHAQAYGPLAVYDSAVPELENETKAVTYLTPEQDGPYTYTAFATPWPLHERYYLVAYSPKSVPLGQTLWCQDRYEIPVPHGLYLVDCYGNRQLIYRDDEIGSISPIPLKKRPKPLVLPHGTGYAFPPGAADPGAEPPETATVSVLDVYESLKPWPKDRPIRRLRVVQLYPKDTPYQDNPPIGHAEMMNARGSLGSVPVEADGSAHFVLPAKIPVYFQALDEDGLAIQTMMSDIYTHPGERLTCVGCHEPPHRLTPPKSRLPLAMKRSASKLDLGPGEGEPMSFARLVQPILEAKCAKCHEAHPDKAPGLSSQRSRKSRSRTWSQAYVNLKPYLWYIGGREKGKDNPHRARTRSTPGQVGAHSSRLYKLLTTGSHADKVQLTDAQLRTITLWLDLNSPFLGAYHDLKEQQEGKKVLPRVE